MPRYKRKTTPKVVRGAVQRKDRHAPTPSYFNTPQDVPAIDRQRPGPGYRHLLKKRDIVDFISILPEWDELSQGLNAILLATGDGDTDGWQDAGVVAICAWERELWRDVMKEFYDEHADILHRLGVPSEPMSAGDRRCQFTEATAKAYQLLHILLHELGHHHDQMTTRSRREASRGESYAEQYAREHERVVWDRYLEVFGLGE